MYFVLIRGIYIGRQGGEVGTWKAKTLTFSYHYDLHHPYRVDSITKAVESWLKALLHVSS